MHKISLLALVCAMASGRNQISLPLNKGHLIQNEVGCKFNRAILIQPEDDLYVRSCLAGKVKYIKKYNHTYDVAIVSDSIILIYSNLNLVIVKLNSTIKQGDKFAYLFSNTANNYLILSALAKKDGKEIDPTVFLK